MHRIILLTLIVFISTTLVAQTGASRFGKVQDSELEMEVYEQDTSAVAVVLFDIGESEILFNDGKGEFQIRYIRHVRIKILKREGTGSADFKLPLRSFSGAADRMTRIRGYTFNKDGRSTDRQKLEKSAIIEEKESDHLSYVIFTMPQVREGSVLDISYEMTSDFLYTLPFWNFQYEIPTAFSEYSIHIPEYFKYRNHVSGYEQLNFSTKHGNKNFTMTYKGNTPVGIVQSGLPVRTKSQRINVSYKYETTIFTAQNVPGLPFEDFVDNRNNYRSKIEFELLTVQFPHSIGQNFTMDWNSVVKELLSSSEFGGQISRARYIRNDMESLLSEDASAESQIVGILNFIRKKVIWNERYSHLSSNGARSAYQNGTGNSAEVNFNLINALQESGFETYPVAVSTRSHGRILPHQVSINSFNHVIALVVIDGKQYLLDATSDYTNPFILPIECLNGNGRIIDKEKNDWIALDAGIQALSNKLIISNINENYQIDGKVRGRYTNHMSARFDRILKRENGVQNLTEHYSKLYNNAEVTIDTFEIHKSGNFPFDCGYSFQSDDAILSAGDMLYVDPLTGFEFDLNPFKAATRKLPVIFNYPFEIRYNNRIIIPEGYEVVDIPEQIAVTLPEGDCTFVFSTTNINNEIVITARLQVNRVLYAQDEYPDLKAMFDIVIQKQSEKIVMKKI